VVVAVVVVGVAAAATVVAVMVVVAVVVVVVLVAVAVAVATVVVVIVVVLVLVAGSSSSGSYQVTSPVFLIHSLCTVLQPPETIRQVPDLEFPADERKFHVDKGDPYADGCGRQSNQIDPSSNIQRSTAVDTGNGDVKSPGFAKCCPISRDPYNVGQEVITVCEIDPVERKYDAERYGVCDSSGVGTRRGRRRHRCETCGQEFGSGKTLKLHQRTHRAPKVYTCEACQMVFSHSKVLAQHRRAHSVGAAAKKRHRCDLCSKEFSFSNDLRKHQRTHSGVRPYVCEVSYISLF